MSEKIEVTKTDLAFLLTLAMRYGKLNHKYGEAVMQQITNYENELEPAQFGQIQRELSHHLDAFPEDREFWPGF